jgi:hypothetical protein
MTVESTMATIEDPLPPHGPVVEAHVGGTAATARAIVVPAAPTTPSQPPAAVRRADAFVLLPHAVQALTPETHGVLKARAIDPEVFPRPDAPLADRLRPHAAEIARLASQPASDWRDPAIALAAREHAQQARSQIAQMNRRGVVVLDEPDDKLDTAVLDAYLHLRRKRRV